MMKKSNFKYIAIVLQEECEGIDIPVHCLLLMKLLGVL